MLAGLPTAIHGVEPDHHNAASQCRDYYNRQEVCVASSCLPMFNQAVSKRRSYGQCRHSRVMGLFKKRMTRLKVMSPTKPPFRKR